MIPTIRLTCRSVLLLSPLVSWVCHERRRGLILCRGGYRSDGERRDLFGSVLATAPPSPAASVMQRLVDVFPDYALPPPEDNSASSDLNPDISLLAATADGDGEIIMQKTFLLLSGSGSYSGNTLHSWEDFSLGNAIEHSIAL